MVQRVLAAKNLNHAKAGVLFTALLKFFVPFLIVFPGLCARVFYERCIHGEKGYIHLSY